MLFHLQYSPNISLILYETSAICVIVCCMMHFTHWIAIFISWIDFLPYSSWIRAVLSFVKHRYIKLNLSSLLFPAPNMTREIFLLYPLVIHYLFWFVAKIDGSSHFLVAVLLYKKHIDQIILNQFLSNDCMIDRFHSRSIL